MNAINKYLMPRPVVPEVGKIEVSCVHNRFWSGSSPDRFWLVVDIYKNGRGKAPDTYLFKSMEG